MTADMKRPGLGGARANPESSCSEVKPSTQQGMVLQQLRQRPMSAAELQWHLPIADARAVVRDLIGKGYCIEKHDHPNPNLDARCRKIRRYHLIEAKRDDRGVDR